MKHYLLSETTILSEASKIWSDLTPTCLLTAQSLPRTHQRERLYISDSGG